MLADKLTKKSIGSAQAEWTSESNMKLIDRFRQLTITFKKIVEQSKDTEKLQLQIGRLLAESVKAKKDVNSLSDVEFRVFSQFGDDGIIQWLLNNLEFPNKTFIEFGVEDYRESNTRFLMMNDNWSGFVMDGAQENVSAIIDSEYYWKHELFARSAFIDCNNINELLSSCPFDREIGILHIDLDGNDYWIWKEIDVICPVLVILEYNSVFGIDRSITIPYDKNFVRTKSHYSNLYWGASLRALHQLSEGKGYSFIGCNTAGNNAYFVRNDKLNDVVEKTTLESGHVISKFRESRDRNGNLTYTAGKERIELIRGMPIYNIDAEQVEEL
jgi:hypothetical protein